MTVELALRNALTLLSMCHVLGSDTDKFDGAMKNIKLAINAIERAKKEVEGHDDHNEQGKNV